MRRWNGWGDEANAMDLPANGRQFLEARIGPGHSLPDATLDAVRATVPESRLAGHPLIDRSPDTRIRHARGQSLPDWLAMRSGEFGVFPDGVAFPETSEQVAELLRWCQEQDVVVIPYGGGTSVAGHINPVDQGKPVLTLSLERMNQLMELDEISQIATFGAGTPGPMVEAQLRARGYTLGHFPQSWELSTVGGWVASRSSGQQSLRYGRIEQLFAGGRVETLRGTLILPPIPASSAGPDLREMILGSEGRMGVITEVKVRVTPLPEVEKFHVIFFRNWDNARDGARALVQQRVPLSMLRVSNAVETETQLALAGHPGQIALLEKALRLRGAGEGKCMMTVGITGSRLQHRQIKSQLRQVLSPYRPVFTGTYLGNKWKEKRFLMPYLRESLWREGYAVDTLETCTPWSNVDRLLNLIEDNLRTVLSAEGVKTHVFTHLSHFYPQGCSIYTTYVFPNGADYAETLARWKRLKDTTSRLIVENGGTISHQHGVGKDHAPYLPVEKGELGISMIRTLCHHLDEAHRLNPGTLLTDNGEQ
ncbi:FAD-binding oxidoreductase [Hahella sp. SMD15-11]|uniref:FAD-binding oxidoreductase n=1 Tax=Thermohahella caldifontis TaxID=3142973 RepID=A0AB39UYD6_9GAMM